MKVKLSEPKPYVQVQLKERKLKKRLHTRTLQFQIRKQKTLNQYLFKECISSQRFYETFVSLCPIKGPTTDFNLLKYLKNSLFPNKHLQKQPSREVLRKGVLKIYSKFTGEHPCQSVHFSMGVLM